MEEDFLEKVRLQFTYRRAVWAKTIELTLLSNFKTLQATAAAASTSTPA
jgi:hypothetical protein